MPQEIEAKFALPQLIDFRQDLIKAGARLLRDRVLERNWRFDKSDGSLTEAHKVLRLRHDIAATLTYKQPGSSPLVRTEIEFEISDHEAARELIEALGYHVILVYEKYRETFAYGPATIELDQLPFGFFIEIETKDQAELKPVAAELGLEWRHRVVSSYAEIFEQWQARTKQDVGNATFSAFADLPPVQLEDLGLKSARPAGAVETAES